MYTEIKKEYHINSTPYGIELSWRRIDGTIHQGYFSNESQMIKILKLLISHGWVETTTALA